MVKSILVLVLVAAFMSLHMVVCQSEDPADPASKRRPTKKSPPGKGKRAKGDPSVYGGDKEKVKQYGGDKGRPKHEWAADGAAGIIEGDIELGRKSRDRTKKKRKTPPGEGEGDAADEGRRAERLAEKLEHKKARLAEKVIGTCILPHWSHCPSMSYSTLDETTKHSCNTDTPYTLRTATDTKEAKRAERRVFKGGKGGKGATKGKKSKKGGEGAAKGKKAGKGGKGEGGGKGAAKGKKGKKGGNQKSTKKDKDKAEGVASTAGVSPAI